MIPLVIGKSSKPRCFKNQDLNNLGVFYRANKSAWLTKTIFLEYLTHINEEMVLQNRKILVLIDNAPGHKINSLSNIKLMELPPNTTSIIQPLDQGIIKAFKNHYRNQLNNFLLVKLLADDLNIKQAFLKLSLLDVFFWIKEALKQVTIKTVKNCWSVFDNVQGANQVLSIYDPELDEEIDKMHNIPSLEKMCFEENCVEEMDDVMDENTNNLLRESTFFTLQWLKGMLGIGMSKQCSLSLFSKETY